MHALYAARGINAPTPPKEEAVMARRRARKQYTLQQRKQILAAADRDGLTAGQVRQKFGVTPVTYYSWRKKYGGAPRKRGRKPGGAKSGALGAHFGGGLTAEVRSAVQSRVRGMVEEIVRGEVGRYVDELFGARRRGRPRKRK
jgi:transposase-like protein